jgi:hypothetical protein
MPDLARRLRGKGFPASTLAAEEPKTRSFDVGLAL